MKSIGSTITKLPTLKIRKALTALYKDLGWDEARQQGFQRRVLRDHDRPRSTQEANKVYQGLEAILKRLFKPYYPKFKDLVNLLYTERYLMTAWERDTFLPDIRRKLDTPAAISPAMVKKVREIAHKYSVTCGFPSFRELANKYNHNT